MQNEASQNSNRMNGTQPQPAAPADQITGAMTQTLLKVLLAGLFGTGGLPPPAMVKVFAEQAGLLLSATIRMGQVDAVQRLREDMKKAFCEAVDSLEPLPVPAPSGQPPEAGPPNDPAGGDDAGS